MIQESIYKYLIDNDDVSKLVESESIGYVSLDEAVAYPKIIFNIVSDPRINEATDRWQRWRFLVSGHDQFIIEDILEALSKALNGLYGQIDVDYIDLISEIDSGQCLKRSDGIYEKYADFRIIYH